MEIVVVAVDKTPVRSWMNKHPATTTYIAIVVTLILLLQIVELLFNVGPSQGVIGLLNGLF